ncbi:MAG TPA: DivIVA domain-containing protein [Acidimicrobiales bacterium]|nr:DivIVA domain-containing protein [Acidimicrobiales bacterium]
MDVSPNTIREIEFREKLRGYNQDDVDEFLERVAAGVEILQERLREATERAVRAEQQAREVFDGDDSLRRTLGLAQRTADLAVQEARDHAARIVEAAEAHGLELAEEARENARRLADEAQSQIWADVGRLEAAREQLRQDVVKLATYLEAERDRIETSLLEAAANLRQAVPGASPPPSLHQLDLSAVQTWSRPSGEPQPALPSAAEEPDENGEATGETDQPDRYDEAQPAGAQQPS